MTTHSSQAVIRPSDTSLSALRKCARPIATALRWVAKRRRLRRDVALLNSMSEHELADIGLRRTDIDAIARGSFRDRRAAWG